MKNKVCAFTGHRPSAYRFGYNEENEGCLKLKSLMEQEIQNLIARGVATFITGMALGADTWGAEIVLNLKQEYPFLQLIAALPCRTQADGWTPEQRDRYFHILCQCDDVFCVGEEYARGCMLQRNRWMVDRAQCVLAVYNGDPKGGTAYTVQYALKKGRPVTAIDPTMLRIQKLEPRLL